jgi:hypothetical protein
LRERLISEATVFSGQRDVARQSQATRPREFHAGIRPLNLPVRFRKAFLVGAPDKPERLRQVGLKAYSYLPAKHGGA